MKNILLLRGWEEEYITIWLRNQGFNVFTLDYAYLPFEIVDHPEHGMVFMFQGEPVLKNGFPAIPHTSCVLGSDGNVNLTVYKRENVALAFSEIDAVLTRIAMGYSVEKGCSVLKLLGHYNVPVMETVDAHIKARSKILSHECFGKHGVLTPKTLALPYRENERNLDKAAAFFHAVNGYTVIKPDKGLCGRGITFPETLKDMNDTVLYFFEQQEDIIIQERILFKNEVYHYRIYVVDEEILFIKKCTAQSGNLCSNMAQGGIITDTTLSDAHKKLAIDAVMSVGLNFAGVDMIISADGTAYIFEVNITPETALIANGQAPIHPDLALLIEKLLSSCRPRF